MSSPQTPSPQTPKKRTSLIAFTTFLRIAKPHFQQLNLTQKAQKELQRFVEGLFLKIVGDALTISPGKTLRSEDIQKVRNIYAHALGGAFGDTDIPFTSSLPNAIGHGVRVRLNNNGDNNTMRLRKTSLGALKNMYGVCTKVCIERLLRQNPAPAKRLSHQSIPALLMATGTPFLM